MLRKKIFNILGALVLIFTMLGSISTPVRADDKDKDKDKKSSSSGGKDIVWQKTLAGKGTAYISMAEDIEFARTTNAVKRMVGKEIGVKFPKMNVIREYQDEARQLFEKNDENYLYANKCGVRFSNAHRYPVPQRGKGPGAMETGSQVTSAFLVRDRVKFYFSETNNSGGYASVTGSSAAMNPMTIGHAITQFEATGVGSVISIDGTGHTLPNLQVQGYSLSYVNPETWTKLTTTSDGFKAGMKTLGKFKMIGEMASKATDEDNPTVDGKPIKSSSQVDKDTKAVDSTGRGFKFSEDLIPNMPKDRDFKDDITKMKFLKPDKFEKTELYSVQKWADEVAFDIEDQGIRSLRFYMMILGFCCCFAGGLLMLLYVFDRNTIFPVSSLGAMTGGRLRVANDVNEYGKGYHVIDTGKKKIKIINFTWVLMWSGIFTLVGVLIMSGMLYEFLSWLVSKFTWFQY